MPVGIWTRAFAHILVFGATDTDRQIAETLFEEGRVLLEAKKYPEACAKFAESQRLDPGGGTFLNLALCHELEGKTATAWTELKEALGQAARDGRSDREDLAREHLAAIEPRLVRVQVLVPEKIKPRSPTVSLDDSKLAPAAWGTAIVVDPGHHRVVVDAEATPQWTKDIDATEEGHTYRVEVPALEPYTTGPAHEAPKQRSKAFWYVLGGAGVALATGVVTGVVALSANSYVKDNCVSARDFCRVDDAGAAADRAHTFAWISTTAFVLAGAAAFTAFFLPREPAR